MKIDNDCETLIVTDVQKLLFPEIYWSINPKEEMPSDSRASLQEFVFEKAFV